MKPLGNMVTLFVYHPGCFLVRMPTFRKYGQETIFPGLPNPRKHIQIEKRSLALIKDAMQCINVMLNNL